MKTKNYRLLKLGLVLGGLSASMVAIAAAPALSFSCPSAQTVANLLNNGKQAFQIAGVPFQLTASTALLNKNESNLSFQGVTVRNGQKPLASNLTAECIYTANNFPAVFVFGAVADNGVPAFEPASQNWEQNSQKPNWSTCMTTQAKDCQFQRRIS